MHMQMHHPRLGACSGGVKESVGWWSVTPTNGSPISIIQFEEPLNGSTHKWAISGLLHSPYLHTVHQQLGWIFLSFTISDVSIYVYICISLILYITYLWL